jgi:hypothetical protein
MSNIITAGNATNNGTSISSDTSGVLELKTGSTPTTALTIGTDQSVNVVKNAKGTVTIANAGSFDMLLSNNFICTPTGGVTLTFTNITVGQSGNIVLVNGSNYAIAKASAVKVASGALTTLSTTGTYWLSYYSPDGTNVYLVSAGALS